MRNYKLFLKKRYNKNPVIIAIKPFKAPNVFASGMIRASCNQDSTANIIPNAEIKSHISFLFFIYKGLLIVNQKINFLLFDLVLLLIFSVLI